MIIRYFYVCWIWNNKNTCWVDFLEIRNVSVSWETSSCACKEKIQYTHIYFSWFAILIAIFFKYNISKLILPYYPWEHSDGPPRARALFRLSDYWTMTEDAAVHQRKRISNGSLSQNGPLWQLRFSRRAIQVCSDRYRGVGAVVALLCLARVCVRRYLRPRARTSHRGTQMMCMHT